MRKLLAVVLILALLPFMAIGAVIEFALFGVSCGRDAAFNLLEFALNDKTGGAA